LSNPPRRSRRTTFDARDRLKQEVTIGTGAGTVTYGYDGNGSVTMKHLNGVLQSTQDWDTRGRLSQVWDGAGKVLESYRYDPDSIHGAVL
jgi:YD repeat-containing protein